MGKEWVARKSPERYGANARRLKETILNLKGLFIKVGQLVSILSNFLPEYFRRELEELQDQIPPRPLSEINTRIQSEFGKNPEELFASFDENAFASASLAQVHKARLHDGRSVAVKVQYMDIEEMAHKDLKTIQRLIGIAGFLFRIRGLDTNFTQVREMILEELDFEKEAQNINEIAANFETIEKVSFPRVVEELSSQRVLTTEFIDGVKISDLDAILSLGIDREELSERVLIAYCQMIFSDGIYHADPHPGNILVQPDGGIVFIDFGAVAQLSPEMKDGIPQFLEACLLRNTEQIVKSLRHMGFIAHDESSYNVEKIIEYVYGRFLESISIDSWNLKDIHVDARMKMEIMADLRKLDISLLDLTSTFRIPKDWILLERVILLLMGLCTHLNPTMNPVKIIRPYLEEFVLGNDRNWIKLISSVAKDMISSALTIPEELKRFLVKTNRGEIEIHVQGLRESTNLLYSLGHQLLYGVFAMVSGSFSYFTYKQGENMLAQGLMIISGFFLLALGGSLVSARRRWHKSRPKRRS